MQRNRITKKIYAESDNHFRQVADRVSFVSITGNLILSVFKLIAGIAAHSNAMISDAVHSASDVFSTVVVMIGIRLASKEADKEHPYGHERMECVAAISLLIAIIKEKVMERNSWNIGKMAQHFYRKLGYKDCGGFIIDVPEYEQPMEMFLIKSRRTLKSPAYQKFFFYFVPVPGRFISSGQIIAVPPISGALPSFYSLLIVSTTVIFLICFTGPIIARHTEPSIMNTITKISHPGMLHSSPHLEVTRF